MKRWREKEVIKCREKMNEKLGEKKGEFEKRRKCKEQVDGKVERESR